MHHLESSDQLHSSDKLEAVTQLNSDPNDLTQFDQLVEQTAKLDPQEVDTESVPQTFNWYGVPEELAGDL